MGAQVVKRKLVAILAADVQGYSRLMGADEVAALRTLTAYRPVTDSLITHYHGRVVNTAGDSILAEFASVVDKEATGAEKKATPSLCLAPDPCLPLLLTYKQRKNIRPLARRCTPNSPSE
jgi:adenylate cyclase